MDILHSNHSLNLIDLMFQWLQIDLFWHPFHQNSDAILNHFNRSKCDCDRKQERTYWVEYLHSRDEINDEREKENADWLNVIVVDVYHYCFCVCVFKDMRDVWFIMLERIFEVTLWDWEFWVPLICKFYLWSLNLWFLFLSKRV